MKNIDVDTLFSLKGKIALVTGGSRGIGKMIAEGYLRSGAKVYISSRNREECESTADALSSFGHCEAFPANIATSDGRSNLVRDLQKREQLLHILVNNAGTTWAESFADYPEDGFSKVINLNLNALFFLTRDLLPLLQRGAQLKDPSRVINIGSIDGLRVPSILPGGTFAYSASKAAVHHITQTLSVELAPHHITVNAVAPGYFESKLTAQVLEDHRDIIERACPLNRIGRPEEMAGIAIYLASRAGAYTTGTVIPVDGGTCVR